MLVQLTDAGVALMQSATAAIVLTSFKLGDSYGYVPSPSQTSLTGSTVYTGIPSVPTIEDANTVKYGLALNQEAGPFSFGEVGLYYNDTLFAIAVADTPIRKLPLDVNANTGGALVLEVYTPMVGSNYQMWANISQANTLKVSTVPGPESLPRPENATPNVFIISGTAHNSKSFLAYTDRFGEWNFDGYALLGQATVVSATRNSVSITTADAGSYAVDYEGSLLCQVISGQAFGTARYVTDIQLDGNGNSIFAFNAPLATIPVTGDRLQFEKKTVGASGSGSSGSQATTETLGTVIVGRSMSITAEGMLNTKQATILTDLSGTILGALVAIQ
jgi:hypothetical protein